MKIMSAQQPAKHNQRMIFLLSSGPIIWLSILSGFIENSSLPVGAGKKGEWFGSLLASPTLLAIAL